MPTPPPPDAMIPSSTLLPTTAHDPNATGARPRNRRPASAIRDATSSSSAIPAAHIGSLTGRNDARSDFATSGSPSRAAAAKNPAGARSGGLLDGSWAPSWASVQEFASSLLTGADNNSSNSSESARRARGNRDASQGKATTRSGTGGTSSSSWGPEPPKDPRLRPRLQHVDIAAAGSQAKRDAALRAMRTASVLESHDGVNGGLDTSGSYKKRSSDEVARGGYGDDPQQSREPAEHLVYIHHVQPNDTYAGIVLRYRCREDAFRKANGLWSRDNIQVRKWLALPVDACEVKGRPCLDPALLSGAGSGQQVDLLAPTPEATTDPFGRDVRENGRDGFFGGLPLANGHPSEQQLKMTEEERPWTHVRWVLLDSSPHPVEIARVERKALGYFPPRRKKSIHTTSAVSTPRGSVDVPSIMLSSGPAGLESPGSARSRRPSLLSTRSQQFSSSYGGVPTMQSAAANRSRVNSSGPGDDARPAWMRRPGGVGSLGRSVRAPGPEKDYLNTWTNKHIPGLNIDSLPSMSVMGSEIARFGFGSSGAEGERVGIVESPFEDGRDTASTSRLGAAGGTGLDKAAASIETWLRGAFSKRPSPGSGTPVLGPRRAVAAAQAEVGDLIELTDTNSDDGRGGGGGGGGGLDFGYDAAAAGGQLFGAFGTSGRSGGDVTAVRGRSAAATTMRNNNKKAD